ncbi:GNAT family N-acetyltransferase [Gilvimarinus sp. F26214L]
MSTGGIRTTKGKPLELNQYSGVLTANRMPIKLRPFRLSDIHDLVAAANHPEISTYLRDQFPYPYSMRDAYWWLTKGIKSEAVHAAITYDGICIGGVSVVFGQAEAQLSGEIGYWLGRDFWGRGIATQAVRQMTEQVFDTTDLLRVHAQVFSPNVASQQVLLKCGYELEGVQRKAVLKNGHVMDLCQFARLRQ